MRAVEAVLGLDTGEQVGDAQTVPSLQLYEELIEAFQKGGFCTAGFRCGVVVFLSVRPRSCSGVLRKL